MPLLSNRNIQVNIVGSIVLSCVDMWFNRNKATTTTAKNCSRIWSFSCIHINKVVEKVNSIFNSHWMIMLHNTISLWVKFFISNFYARLKFEITISCNKLCNFISPFVVRPIQIECRTLLLRCLKTTVNTLTVFRDFDLRSNWEKKSY